MLPELKIIAHRGASAYAPENTLAAFSEATNMHANCIEFDVMLSSDGVPFVFHDDTLDRTTNGTGPFDALDSQALKALDAGGWFSSRFHKERIPTLEETLHFILKKNIYANIEIKPTPGKTQETTTAVMTLLHQLWPSELPLPLVSSFDHNALSLCRAINPDLPIGILYYGFDKEWKRLAHKLSPVAIHINKEAVTKARVSEIKNEGYRVFVYTVNTAKTMNKLFRWGVDAIFSDYPDLGQ